MGILKSLFTLGKSFVAQAEDAIDEAQGGTYAGAAYSRRKSRAG